MAALGCLIKDTQIIRDIQEVMEILARDARDLGRKLPIDRVYSFLRQNGIEVDLESVGSIYENTFDLTDDMFTSKNDLDAKVGRLFNETVDNLVAMQPQHTQEQIGVQSPGKKVARTIAGMFRSAMVTDVKTQSLMRKFQNALERGAKRLLDKSAVPDPARAVPKTFEEILAAAFDLETHGVRTLSGGMNNLQDVWREFMKEMEAYKNEMQLQGASLADVAAFDNYTQKMVATGYNIFLSQKEAQDVLKGALIDAGFSRMANIKGVQTAVLDWRKLAGIVGDPQQIRDNVARVLKDKGYTDAQINRIQNALVDEYIRLKASIIEKAANDLKNRDKSATVGQKSAAQRLAEMYTLGLFDAAPGTYANVMNKLFGMNNFDQQTYAELQALGKAMQTLFSTSFQGEQLQEADMKYAINSVNEQVKNILARHASNQSVLLRIARIIQAYMEMAQRMLLNTIKNAGIQNRLSGWFAKLDVNAGYHGSANPAIRRQQREVQKATYKDIHVSGGVPFGDVDSIYINRSSIDQMFKNWGNSIRNPAARGVMQRVISFAVGREGLEALDSSYKAIITDKMLIHNLIKILTNPTNPNAMTKEAAIQYVAAEMTGQKFSDAKALAQQTIAKINRDAGKELIVNTPASVTRLANDIVKASLITGGKITREQLEAAYESAYKAAGRDLGHVANNLLSRSIQNLNNWNEQRINEAIKKKNYIAASGWTMSSILFRNILNPFVGGATNWIVLKTEKLGLGLAAGPITMLMNKGKNLDLTSDADMKELQEQLYEDLKAKNKVLRGALGGMTSLLLWGLFNMMDQCKATKDEKGQRRPCGYEKWRKDNKWGARYLDEFTPEYYLAELQLRDGKLGEYFMNYINSNDKYGAGAKLTEGYNKWSQGEMSEGWGKIGEAIGQKFNVPVPWRLVKDVYTITQGIFNKGETFTFDYSKSKGFWEGATKGGFLEFIGLNIHQKYSLDALPGVGGKNLERLNELGIHDIKDLKGKRLKYLRYKDAKGRRRSILNKEQREQVEEILNKEYGN